MTILFGIVAMILWVVLMGFMFWHSGKKKTQPVPAKKEESTEAKTTTTARAFDGFQIVRENGVITININPALLNKKIQLKMENNNQDLTMQVLSGEADEAAAEVTPEADVNESEIMTPTDVVNEFLASDNRVNNIMLSQLEELAREGKAEFVDPTE